MGPVTLPIVASVEDGEAVMRKSLAGGGGPELPPQAPSSAANQTTLRCGFDSVRGTGLTPVKAPTIRQFPPRMRKKYLFDRAGAAPCGGILHRHSWTECGSWPGKLHRLYDSRAFLQCSRT